jgi:hypothetical protein
MPTAFSILVAALVAVAPAELRLTAELMGLRVRAAVRNTGTQAVTLEVGDRCAGPVPFTLVVDGKPRPFVAEARPCTTPQPISRTLPPGGEYAILSDSLDGRRHTVVARFGAVAAPPLLVETLLRLRLTVTATARVRAGQPIAVEVIHVNRSPEAVTVPGCGEDRLLVDDHEQPLPRSSEEPCTEAPRVLKVGGAFVTRARLRLAVGHHQLRARWRELQSDDVTVDVTP